MDILANAVWLSEAMRPKRVGKPVNVHVVRARPEPKPDFAAMERLLRGEEQATT